MPDYEICIIRANIAYRSYDNWRHASPFAAERYRLRAVRLMALAMGVL